MCTYVKCRGTESLYGNIHNARSRQKISRMETMISLGALNDLLPDLDPGNRRYLRVSFFWGHFLAKSKHLLFSPVCSSPTLSTWVDVHIRVVNSSLNFGFLLLIIYPFSNPIIHSFVRVFISSFKNFYHHSLIY